MYEDDGAGFWLSPFGEPGIRSDGDESKRSDGLHRFLIGDEPREAEEDRGGDAVLE